MEESRTPEQRMKDMMTRLEGDRDAWVATANAKGDAYLVPLNFVWIEDSLIVSTPISNSTARNLERGKQARVGVGLTRDVVLIEGFPELLSEEQISIVGDAFAAKHGWDPRLEEEHYGFFRINPRRIQVWRSLAELPDRILMDNGVWLV